MVVSERKIPWVVRYAKARVDMGLPVPSWLRLAVDMGYNPGGCASCAALTRRTHEDEDQ